jgi:diphosphomevalonate decarboxylase
MNPYAATACASPNIALIKYWGNRDPSLRIPSNGSISMTLGGLECRTEVTFAADLSNDALFIDGQPTAGDALQRVSAHLDLVRHLSRMQLRARVDSWANFPAGAGLASSAAAFAALSLAATTAAGLDLDPQALSRLARRGSGSACRSLHGGFVEWFAGRADQESYAGPLVPADHWDLVDLIALVSHEPKAIGSSAGHALASTSPLQDARVADADRRLDICRRAILNRDFDALAEITELDSNLMHAVMLTSTPPLLYWLPATVEVLQAVLSWRRQGIPICYTIDAGPNVHCLTTAEAAADAAHRLEDVPGVDRVLACPPGGPAHLAGTSVIPPASNPPG